MILLLGIILSVAMVMPASSAASGGSTVVIPSSGTTISASQPWSGGSVSTQGDDIEVVVLTGTNDTLLVGYLPGQVDRPVEAALAAADLTLPELQDLQVNDQWVFQSTTIDDVPYGLFGLIQRGVAGGIEVQIYISPVSTFGDGVIALRNAVNINGVPIFTGMDGAALQATLVSRTGEGDAVADAARAPLTATTMAEGGVASPSDEPDVTWSGRWTSPRYGINVRWSSDWKIGTPPMGFVAARPSDESSADSPDQLVLERVDGSGTTLVLHLWPSDGESPVRWFPAWSVQNATYGMTLCRLDGDSPSPRVVGTVVRYIDGARVGDVDVREARFAYGDMAHLVVDLALPSGSTGEDFRTATSGVTINGESPFLLVRPYNVDAATPGLSPTQDAGNALDGR